MPDYGYIRVAAVSPKVHVSDPYKNMEEMLAWIGRISKENVQLAIFPELGMTGYTCKDLFLQTWLQQESRKALETLVAETRDLDMVILVGAPLKIDDQLFNVAVAIQDGQVLGVVPKTHLPGYKEFEERRWFAPAARLKSKTVLLGGKRVPVGTNLVFESAQVEDFKFAIEICEDLWMPIPPSSHHCLHGATVLCNLSASNEVVGKASYRRKLVESQSARCVAGYVYSSCGDGESTSDVVFSGHCIVAENGNIIMESERFKRGGDMVITDLDVERLVRERIMTDSFGDAIAAETAEYIHIPFDTVRLDVETDFRRTINPDVFIPSDPRLRDEVCQEVFNIATMGLGHRLEEVFGGKDPKVNVGESGGLDSLLSLFIIDETYDRWGWDKSGINAVTMPGPGTSARTLGNAKGICEALGIGLKIIDITEDVTRHLEHIGHSPACMDCLQCENAQARERTQILMDLGFTVGTGDLSEGFIGWMTYNGDHMSNYNPNCSIPKTLVKYVVLWKADQYEKAGNLAAAQRARDIAATPISPELRKLGEGGVIAQKSEEENGPYRAVEFFGSSMLRYGIPPEKIFFLARQAFKNDYNRDGLLAWLKKYIWKFFRNQFKRDAAPDGAKVGTVALSQRGDLRLASDVNPKPWVDSLPD